MLSDVDTTILELEGMDHGRCKEMLHIRCGGFLKNNRKGQKILGEGQALAAGILRPLLGMVYGIRVKIFSICARTDPGAYVDATTQKYRVHNNGTNCIVLSTYQAIEKLHGNAC